ncbi:MAG TPA: hypothetical protein DD460_06630 [Acidobacteria bacterium]|nr:hypothetical protein [Acidobacteriota bacterium]
MTRSRKLLRSLFVVGVIFLFGSFVSQAQPASSASLVEQLKQLMDDQELSAIATQDPTKENHFVAALYFSGRQVLAVSAPYSAPLIMSGMLDNEDYRNVYIDLSSASDPAARFFVDDFGADGLQAESATEGPRDSVNRGGQQVALDVSDLYAQADQDYAEILRLLIGKLR